MLVDMDFHDEEVNVQDPMLDYLTDATRFSSRGSGIEEYDSNAATSILTGELLPASGDVSGELDSMLLSDIGDVDRYQ